MNKTNYTRELAPRKREIDRQSLPTPEQYLAKRRLLQTTPRGAWASIRCPAHKGGEEQTPSLRVNLKDGHFRCMACGVKGGDIIALHRLLTGRSFLDTVRDLGGRFHV